MEASVRRVRDLFEDKMFATARLTCAGSEQYASFGTCVYADQCLGDESGSHGEALHLTPDRPSLDVGAEPVPGYRLVSWISKGGSGEVWKARGPAGFPVAMKLIPLGNEHAATERRALELLRGIRHPNLVAVFGAWENNGLLVVAMELADRTLWERYHEAVGEGLPGIPKRELIAYLRDAARAIDFLNRPCHTLMGREKIGIQHRDIKPHNLVLVGGSVKVADFGLARLAEHAIPTDSVHLTPAYAGPECFQGQTSCRSDQYSLAITYCQLRGGRLPFTGSVWQVMLGHSQDDPDLGMLPEEEKPIVARALAKRPGDRWPNCRTLIDELANANTAEDRSATRRMPQGNSEPTRRSSVSPAGSCRGRRRGGLPVWVAAASVLVLFMAPKAGHDFQQSSSHAVAQPLNDENGWEVKAGRIPIGRGEEVRPAAMEPPEEPEEKSFAEVVRRTDPPSRGVDLALGHNARGEALHAGRNYDLAVAEFTEALRRNPQFALAYCNRGNAHAARGDDDQALADYAEALQIDPGCAGAYRQRGHLQAARGNHGAAIADYQRALRIDPADAAAHHGKGLVFYFKGDYERAIAGFTEALWTEPTYVLALNGRALAHTARGDLARALADFSAALRIDPRYAEALNNRGVVHCTKGDLGKALADFSQALGLEPKNPVYERNRARVAARLRASVRAGTSGSGQAGR
jgi:serine/threonine protein kinase/Tfp pilus assembly protein PilF